MLLKEEKEKIIKKFQQSKNDTGSSEVQIAILTKTINELVKHLEVNKKDVVAKRSLLKKVSQRKRLLQYLIRTDFDKYKKIINALKLRK